MSVVVVAVVLVGMLCLLDLLLTLGVIRRLREHTSHLERLLSGVGLSDPLPSIGEPVGEFSATTIEGRPISQEWLAAETLVAFLSPGCAPCTAKLPGFIDYARRWANGQRQVLAVVTGPAEQTTEMVASLRPVATTVVDGVDGPVSRAFKAQATPVFCHVDEGGRVVAASFDLEDMSALVEA